MKKVLAMSHIVDLEYKGKLIRLYMREKLGKHQAPYVIAKQADGNEIHIRIETLDTYDDTGFDNKVLSFVKKWMVGNKSKLMGIWRTMKEVGRAPKLSPKHQIIKALVHHVVEIKTTENLLMALRLENGDIRIADFKKIIPKNPALEILKDPKIFKRAKVFGSGIRWEKEDIDLEVNDVLEFSKPIDLKKLMSTYE